MRKSLLAMLLCALLTLTAGAEDFLAPIDMSAPAIEAGTACTPGREKCGKPNCYWETPMDYANEALMWGMLTAPITVIDGNFRTQANVYAEPSADSKVIGEVTRASMGVHVLENLDNGWSRIECYSSCFAGSRVKVWNDLIVGYVETASLKEVEVRTEFGLIVDKLTQRLYVYQEGRLIDELLVSTGKATKSEPYNETCPGEFMLYSPTGDFPSDPFLCSYGIRYNDGDLLHEVPHIVTEDGGKDFSRTESALGSKASHGCIRVQRKRTEEGRNMTWLWNNLRDKMKTRIVIWEDYDGRVIPTPADDVPLYYNPIGGRNYHDSPTCYGVLDKYEPMTAFTYGEFLDEPFDGLKPCPYCVPPRRPELIDQLNEQNALLPT